MTLANLHSSLALVWELWFVALFVGVLVAVLRPGKRSYYQEQGLIPLRDDAADPAPLRPRA